MQTVTRHYGRAVFIIGVVALVVGLSLLLLTAFRDFFEQMGGVGVRGYRRG